MQKNLEGFVTFIREQGVIGLAVGIILGGSVKELVSALISDFISPVLGLLLKSAGNLSGASFNVYGATFMWGHFVSTLIDFIVVAAVIYYVIKGLKLDKLDKPKS
ncbi:MAG: MscL family protein [Niabella sp.]|nr:MAG: MscL family protein [Niabella sp.]